MIFSMTLIALHLLTASKEINGSSDVKESQQSLHNRLHIRGDQNWANNDLYKYNVMITWNIKAEIMTLKTEREIGKIKNQTLYYKCSGVIIAPGWVITAASCFQPRIRKLGKEKDNLVFFVSDGLVLSLVQNRSIDVVYAHKDYVEISKRGDIDIALVRLKKDFSTNESKNDYVTVARLAENMAYSENMHENRMRDCRVASFGEEAITAESPFTRKLSMYDVRAAGPKYCEYEHRTLIEPWYNEVHPMMQHTDQENDMFDSFFICTTPHDWFDDGERLQENEAGLGCFGAVGGALTCDDDDVLVGVQSQRVVPHDVYYCAGDIESYTTFTSVGHAKVYDWIKLHVPGIGTLVSLHDTQYPLDLRGGKDTLDGNTTYADDTSSTTSVLVWCSLSPALSIIALTFKF